MANRFERINNTAPVTDVAENLKPNVQYSYFDETCKEIGQALPYALIPIDVIRTLPNTEIDLNYDVQISFRNPTIRKLLNGFRVYLHAYYNKNSDLWEGWNNFITKGRSGEEILKIPHIANLITGSETVENIKTYSPFTPMSLYDYLGYTPEIYGTLDKHSGLTPIERSTTIPTENATKLANYNNVEISALPAMMYQRLWRDKYAPKNLLQNNKYLFPSNEDHFILSYNANEIKQIKYENEDDDTIILDDSESIVLISPNQEEWYIGQKADAVNLQIPIRLDCLRFRQFQGDRFTTASPFENMLRGEEPYMDLSIEPNEMYVNIPRLELEPSIIYARDTNNKNRPLLFHPANNQETSGTGVLQTPGIGATQIADGQYIRLGKTDGGSETGTSATVYTYEQRNVQVQGDTIRSKITLNDLRSLEVFTIFAERMARTNGDYNEMINAQFGHKPHQINREAFYIGGSFQDIVQNSIYQTSESTETGKLGEIAGQGISASYNQLGKFTADDYGIVMVIMSIIPETIYTTGIDIKDTQLTFEEQYFPIMNNLSAEAILNKELFVSGNAETDNDVFGYSERYEEYKSRRNKVKGFSQLPSTISAYDSALIMSRKFETTQNLNANFVTGTPNNVSLNAFASEDEPPFDYAIIKDVKIRYPMPYVTIPQGLGTRA